MLEINWWVVGLTVVNFFVVVLIVRKLLLKPVLKILDERKQLVAREIDEADSMHKEAEILLAKAKHELESQRNNANKLINDAVKNSEAKQESVIKEARIQAREIIDQAHIDVQMERERSLREHQADIVDLSVSMAEQLLTESIQEDTQTRLIDDFINELDLDASAGTGAGAKS